MLIYLCVAYAVQLLMLMNMHQDGEKLTIKDAVLLAVAPLTLPVTLWIRFWTLFVNLLVFLAVVGI